MQANMAVFTGHKENSNADRPARPKEDMLSKPCERSVEHERTELSLLCFYCLFTKKREGLYLQLTIDRTTIVLIIFCKKNNSKIVIFFISLGEINFDF